MKYTSAEAAKLLNKLNEQYSALESIENQSMYFLAAVGEDIESVRPEYDYESVQKQFEDLENKILKVKHAINMFNSTHTVPGFDLTIDQMLVYLPQLSNKKRKLLTMKSRLPKERVMNRNTGSNIIDYSYTNYDIKKVEADYNEVSDILAKAQTALDVINNTETMDIDL